MIGVPPAAGFISKWYMLSGAFQANQMVVVAILVISTLLNAGYFLPIVYRAFFKAPAGTTADAETPGQRPDSRPRPCMRRAVSAPPPLPTTPMAMTVMIMVMMTTARRPGRLSSR